MSADSAAPLAGLAQVSTRLREVREERGLTQSAVANRSKMVDPEQRGISRTALVGYEQGTSNPGLREIMLLCEVLRITPNRLLYGADSAGSVDLPAMEAFRLSGRAIESVLKGALTLMALKPHERDALLSLALSLAGRQLGDQRLAGLLGVAPLIAPVVLDQLREWGISVGPDASLEDVADAVSKQLTVSVGTTLRFTDDGDVSGGSEMYPDPKVEKPYKKLTE